MVLELQDIKTILIDLIDQNSTISTETHDNISMTQENRYDWKELKQYLEAFIEAQVDQDMNDPDFTEEMNWTEHKSRKNAVENLRDSLTIMFPNELIDIDV